jgi:nucleotide-binding universal stress UspA family protein
MNEDILVPIDRSEESKKALEVAFEEHPESSVFVVHVTETSDPLGLLGRKDPAEYMVPECGIDLVDGMLPDGDLFTRAQRRRAEQVLDSACSLSNAYDVDIEPLVRSGDVVEEIVACAEERDVDRILITEHCRTELRPFRRSVPEAIALNTDVPVIIVG